MLRIAKPHVFDFAGIHFQKFKGTPADLLTALARLQQKGRSPRTGTAFGSYRLLN
jgi:hypothetical protein